MEASDSKPPVKGKDPAGGSSGKPKSVSSSRPKTSTQRLDNILDDDLRNFGSLSSRLSTPSSSEGGDQQLQRRGTKIKSSIKLKVRPRSSTRGHDYKVQAF